MASTKQRINAITHVVAALRHLTANGEWPWKDSTNQETELVATLTNLAIDMEGHLDAYARHANHCTAEDYGLERCTADQIMKGRGGEACACCLKRAGLL